MSRPFETHERGALERREDPTLPRGGSDRGFGLVFAALFAGIGMFPLVGGGPPRVWALTVSGVFLALAFLRAGWLAPLRRVWFRLGLLLQRLFSPIVLAVIYFGVVTPVGLLRRRFGTDPLSREFDPEARSYWIRRDPPGPAPESLSRQF